MSDRPRSSAFDRRSLLRRSSAFGVSAGIGIPAIAAAQVSGDGTGPLFGHSWLDARRDFGAVGDDAADDTASLDAAFQAAGATHTPLVIPPGRYRLSGQIFIPSNTTVFGYGAVILNYLTEPGFAGVPLNIHSVTDEPVANVRLYGIEVDGRKGLRTDGKAGLRLHGNVDDVFVKDCWFHDNSGDGWYTLRATNNPKLYPYNCVFEDVICSDNGRQGASITVGKHITVRGGRYTGTGGALPSAGIDIEPDAPDTPCEDITIDGVEFSRNEGAGLLIDYAAPGLSPIRNIRISNCLMFANENGGALIRACRNVVFADNVVTGNQRGGILLDAYADSPLETIHIRDTIIYDNAYSGIFGVLAPEGATGRNWKFSNLTIEDNGIDDGGYWQGIYIDNGIDDVQIIGCTIGNREKSFQQYGIVTGSTVSRLRVDLNNLSGNRDGAVLLLDDEDTRLYGAMNSET